ncbi:MAG TPA: toll/interleukin-1 receptor domain-containing protein [Trebonia sp.]|nr:toll/interleukin-1 receptor domain-containing protein [Trebonia sp.]
MQLFISYARPDRTRAESLTLRLRQAGINVWLDSDLVGGQAWWDRILDQLRSCDAVVAAVSRASIKSQACRSEREYAAILGKPILPLTLEPMSSEMLPADIARIQTIDYSQPSEAAAFELIGAILTLPKAGELPDPVPEAPPVPTSPFGTLVDRLAEPTLSMDDQLAIVGRLEAALGPAADPHDRPTALELLRQLDERPDLFAAAARQIVKIRAQLQAADQQQGSASQARVRQDPRYGGTGPVSSASARNQNTPPPRADHIDGTAMIYISRQPGELQYKLNAWLIFIDGKKVGKIWQAQRRKYPITPGTHQIQIRLNTMSSHCSPVEVFTVNAGDCAEFSCGLDHPLTMGNAFTAGAWKGQLMAPKNSFIRLSRERP